MLRNPNNPRISCWYMQAVLMLALIHKLYFSILKGIGVFMRLKYILSQVRSFFTLAEHKPTDLQSNKNSSKSTQIIEVTKYLRNCARTIEIPISRAEVHCTMMGKTLQQTSTSQNRVSKRNADEFSKILWTYGTEQS